MTTREQTAVIVTAISMASYSIMATVTLCATAIINTRGQKALVSETLGESLRKQHSASFDRLLDTIGAASESEGK